MSEDALDKLQVLVVNPVAGARYQELHLLRQLGIVNVHQASGGEEALQVARLRKPDLVISEWQMLDMDGLALLRALRADPQMSMTPLVLVTADVDRELVRQAVEGGVSDLLVKPYTLQRLEDKVRGALRRTVLPPLVASDAPSPSAAKAEQPVLLAVDDTPDNLRLMADLFSGEFRVKVADNGEKALAICAGAQPPDLVLLDVMMPGMDGFEVARRLREMPQGEMLPVIFVTALDDEASRVKGFGTGAVDFVTKPIEPDLLLLRVRNFLRWVNLHKQRQQEFDRMLDDARREAQRAQALQDEVKQPLQRALEQARALRDTGKLQEPERGALDGIERRVEQALAAAQKLQQS